MREKRGEKPDRYRPAETESLRRQTGLSDSCVRAIFPCMMWMIVSGLVYAALDAAGLLQGENGSVVRTGIVSAILIPFSFRLLRRWNPEVGWKGGRKPAGKRSAYFVFALAILCGAALSLCYGWLSSALHLTEHFSNETQEDLFSASFGIQLAVLGILTPISEELMFRGLMFGNLRKAVPNAWAAVVTSAAFALIHGNMVQMIYAFPMALVLQLFLNLQGGLCAPVALHISANVTSVIAQYIIR